MFCFFRHVHPIKVTTAAGFHLFPFRTEQLSPPAPMVLRNSGRVGRRRLREPRRFLKGRSAGLLFVYASVAFFVYVPQPSEIMVMMPITGELFSP